MSPARVKSHPYYGYTNAAHIANHPLLYTHGKPFRTARENKRSIQRIRHMSHHVPKPKVIKQRSGLGRHRSPGFIGKTHIGLGIKRPRPKNFLHHGSNPLHHIAGIHANHIRVRI